MATLTSPVNAQNIVDRFADYLVATANSGIVYGSNSWPFYDASINLAPFFGGTTAGKPIGIIGTNLGSPGIVTAYTIFYQTLNETFKYTMIRNTTWIIRVSGGGGNTGVRPAPGDVTVRTGKSYLNSGYVIATNVSAVSQGQVVRSLKITTASLEDLFNRLRAAWTNFYNGNPVTLVFPVCHASCHSSCHSSRSRR
jgi:hypothetical protein